MDQLLLPLFQFGHHPVESIDQGMDFVSCITVGCDPLKSPLGHGLRFPGDAGKGTDHLFDDQQDNEDQQD